LVRALAQNRLIYRLPLYLIGATTKSGMICPARRVLALQSVSIFYTDEELQEIILQNAFIFGH